MEKDQEKPGKENLPSGGSHPFGRFKDTQSQDEDFSQNEKENKDNPDEEERYKGNSAWYRGKKRRNSFGKEE